jgi:hypothetical protein
MSVMSIARRGATLVAHGVHVAVAVLVAVIV